MTSQSAPIDADHQQVAVCSKIFSLPPVSSSRALGWKNIQLDHHFQTTGEIPEIVCRQHTIVLPNWKQSTEFELIGDAKVHRLSFDRDRSGWVDILPANHPFKCTWNQSVEFTLCHLEPTFISQVAYESVDPDRVEFPVSIQQPSPLIWQMGMELRSLLEQGSENSCFYTDTIATAMAAHLLFHHATRRHIFKEYDGLPNAKLKLAIDYINAHLGENISLNDIAMQLDMSQYHFSRLFKQSMGITAHNYLIQRRIARSKQLLRETELTILEISNECGFANPSHFARCFRQQMGIAPMQFRRSG